MKKLYLAVASSLIGVMMFAGSVFAAEPPWPDDPTVPHTATVVAAEGLGGQAGQWVWDYSRFVSAGDDTYIWSPGWRWEPAANPSGQ